MRNTLSILALASSAAATGWTDSQAFTCPSNTNNQCSSQLSSGFDFTGLDSGVFSSYGGMVWNQWTCNSAGKRFAPRTGGSSISGSCGHDKSSSPSFGCDSSTPDFSVSSYHVTPEFDCDLEFQYDMPDGSTCKHRNACSASGTTVTNAQCGGARNVTIVYPSGQPSLSKSTCSVTVSTVSFDCSSASSTVPVKTTSQAATSPTATGATSTTKPTSPVQTTSPAGTSPVKTTTPAIKPSPAALNSTSTSPATITWTTSFQTTSTIFTTSVHTVTSCAASITNCPADSSTHVTEVTETVALTTTICPVTETRTSVIASSPAGVQTTHANSTVVVASSSSAVMSAPSPTATLSCPGVVPSCLNTFIWMTGCSDNGDAGCFCVEDMFISNVYDCMYAHGGSDEEVSEAVLYLMGLCGGFADSNPAVVTAATVTSYLTATATSVASVYTTVTVHATTVRPCTDSAGAIIPSSSTTVVINTAIPVPQVGLATGASGAVGVVPATALSTAAAATGTGSRSGAPPFPTGTATTAAARGSSAGTIGASAASHSSTGIVINGAGRTGAAGFGAAALAVMGLVAAL